jgi:predicted TIM-barrel fold metal-dependent hydrolase
MSRYAVDEPAIVAAGAARLKLILSFPRPAARLTMTLRAPQAPVLTKGRLMPKSFKSKTRRSLGGGGVPKRLFDAHNHLWAHDDGTRMVESQQAFGVETTVVMGVPFDNEAEIRRINERLIRAQEKFPGKLIGGVYADPRQGKKAVELVRRAHGEGIRLVKLFPNLGYYPDDDKVRPFFDKVAELKMAVLTHCGWLLPQKGKDYAAYYSHPGRFEKLLRIYPETIFIFAHMGGISGFLDAIMLTTRTPNAYVDCAPGQGWWVLESAPAMAGTIPPDRLMWGADMPYRKNDMTQARKALLGAGFGAHLDKIYYANARGIYEKLGVLKPKMPTKAARG